MKGAREYCKLFETGQYGRLYITSSSHARGNTFHIQVLPHNEKAIPNGSQNLCLNKNAVEVYGILGGNSGWTEYYGWIHKGLWQSTFEAMVVRKKNEILFRKEKETIKKKKNKKIKLDHDLKLLASYKETK